MLRMTGLTIDADSAPGNDLTSEKLCCAINYEIISENVKTAVDAAKRPHHIQTDNWRARDQHGR
jgi:hypothetical protein